VEPSADEIRAELGRVLASDGFANAERMSKFLGYVVERSLAGEGEQIKEYAIGIDVFGRDANYDPRLDSIVRVEARRLRSKVEEYYAGPGHANDVIIQLRRGSYVPAFERRSHAAAVVPDDAPALVASNRPRPSRLGLALLAAGLMIVTLAAWGSGRWSRRPPVEPAMSIAVLPFTNYSTETEDQLLAARLTDGVTSELAKMGTLRVVSHTSVLQFAGSRTPLLEIAKTLNANVLLEGTVERTGHDIRVAARLVSGTSNYKLWVENVTGTTADPRDLERRIASQISSAALKARQLPAKPRP
jgi:adenylate cyclase